MIGLERIVKGVQWFNLTFWRSYEGSEENNLKSVSIISQRPIFFSFGCAVLFNVPVSMQTKWIKIRVVKGKVVPVLNY
jgi:hypothetical protein